MARPPTVPILAGTGGGIIPPQALIKPEYKMVLDISGGINTSRPPDQLLDKESPDMLNLVYVNKVLCVDFGIMPLGTPTIGIPQQPIEFTQPQLGTKFNLLVTTRTLYSWSTILSNWVPIPTNTTSPATVTSQVNGTGTNPSVAFTGAATWTSGQLVAVQMDNSQWFVGTTSGTTSPVTIGSPLAVGRDLAAGKSILPLPTFTSDGTLSISWATDPSHGWLMFTNGFDLPQRFDGNVCLPITNVSGVVTTARHIARYHGVTVLTYTTESGVVFPYRVRRSATNDPTNWTTLDAGVDDLVDTGDPITDVVLVNPYLAIIRAESIVRASYYGLGLQVFWYDYGLSFTGSIANQASNNTKTAAIVVAESGVYQYNGDYGLTDLGDNIYNLLLTYTGALNVNSNLAMFLIYVPMLDETWIVFSENIDLWPTTILRYNHKNSSWFKRSFSAAGLSFAGGGLWSAGNSVRWVDLAGTRWIDRHRAWNARANAGLFHMIILCGATNNQTYLYDFNTTTADNGTPISWYFVSKDYPLPEEWKTLDGLVFYGKGIIGLVEISTDYGVTWHQLGANITLGAFWARGSLDCSLTCEFVRVRFSGTDPSFKLSWFAFKTMSASEH